MINLCVKDLKNIFLLLLLHIATHSFSQEQDKSDISDVTKATFLSPGVSYEKRIGRVQSLYAQAYLSTAIYIGYSSALGNTSGIYF